jgi:hypothetical protein
MELVRYGGNQVPEELGGDHVVGFFMQFGIGEFAWTVNGDKSIELAFFRAYLGDIDMEVADRI